MEGSTGWLEIREVSIAKHDVGIMKEPEVRIFLEHGTNLVQPEGMEEIVVIEKSKQGPGGAPDALRGHRTQSALSR